MREELRTIGSKGRHVFTATFVRFGFRNGYIGPVKTMLLQDVTLDSKIVSDQSCRQQHRDNGRIKSQIFCQ